MSELFSIAGKTALVTGGSRGIGEMIVRGFADAGAKVYLSSRKADACESLAEELRAEGKDVTALPADLSTESGCAGLGGELERRESKLHILLNNAGAVSGAPIEALDETAWDRVLSINVKGVFFTTRFLLPLLEAASSPEDPARVINIGSIDGLRVPMMETYSYSTSKAGLHMLTRHLASRLAPSITVNAIAPGPFPSKMMRSTLEAFGDQIAASAPMKRIGRSSDMAGAAIYLASPAASYVTGAILPVDGGIATCS